MCLCMRFKHTAKNVAAAVAAAIAAIAATAFVVGAVIIIVGNFAVDLLL